MDGSSPARLYATLVGGALVIGGILGFFYEAGFDTGERLPSDELLGLLAVNGWHNVVHLASGVLGLAAAGYAARSYALGFGLAYTLLAIWGFLAVEDGYATLLDLLPVNTEDNVFHLFLGLTGLGAGAATVRKPPPRTRRAPEI